jgi:HAD superfamily hydrolase (TIGR01509 family)
MHSCLNHIGIEVSDIFTMEVFYLKFFKFKTIYRYVSINQKKLRTVLMKNDCITIELLERENISTAKEHQKRSHIALTVPDVNAEYLRLKALGLENLMAPRVTGDGFIEAAAYDPEGNTIEISKRIAPIPHYPIKAVIFDLDGTIIDSEPNYFEGDRRLLLNYGISLTADMKEKYVGIGSLEMMKDMKKIFNIRDSLDTLLRLKNEYYIEEARKNTKVFPEMLKFIRLLKNIGYELAVASGASPGILKEMIDMTGLNDHFSAIVSAETAGKGKPAPDVFIETSRRLKINPVNCLVIEDSQYGVEAAKRAFMHCIAVPYLSEKPISDRFLAADLLFRKGMNDFSAARALKWVLRNS